MFVVIILLVTGDAILVVLCVEDGGIAWNGMAGRTIGLLVCAEELESVGYLLMRERSIFPGVYVVAVLASGGESGAGMFFVIVGLMATDAILVAFSMEDQAVPGQRMAGGTGYLFMCPDEFEAPGSQSVIENGIVPGLFVVAVDARYREA